MKFGWIVAVAAATLGLVGCGGGIDKNKAQVRLVNASLDYTSLQMRVDGSTLQSDLPYGSTADYAQVDPGKATTEIIQTGSATALLSFTPSVSKGDYYTLLAYGALGNLKQLQIDDNLGAPDTGQTFLRVINAAPDAGALDIYITGANDSLASSVPVQAGAGFGALGTALTINSGTWRLRVTGANDRTDIRLDRSGLVLDSRQVATLVLAPGTGGVLVNALLLSQQGAITRQDNAQARVRVAAGLAGGGSVSTRVGGTEVGAGVSSPAVSNYTLVAAGAQSVAVSVNGTALTATTQTLEAGTDYTLLLHGATSSPRTAWLTDDNHLPSGTTQAALRLVNGVSPLVTPLALTVDFLPVASNVAPASASAYVLVGATTTGKFSVTADAASVPLFTAVDQTLTANSVYSLFVVGADTAAVGILRKDR
jgi:hypothetical protein